MSLHCSEAKQNQTHQKLSSQQGPQSRTTCIKTEQQSCASGTYFSVEEKGLEINLQQIKRAEKLLEFWYFVLPPLNKSGGWHVELPR